MAAGVGCSLGSDTREVGSLATASAPEPAPLPVVAPPPLPEYEPNPLGLVAEGHVDVAPGQQVFTIPHAMLRGAKLGSSLTLRVASVIGREGDNLLIAGRETPSYKVHVSYAIVVPDDARPKLNQPVIVEWGGQLRHAAVKRFVRDSVTVRFVDSVDRGERTLKKPALIPQVDGFRPGNYVVREEGTELKHYLLVSRVGGGEGRWLALGYAGAATIVEESRLFPVPVTYEPREGTIVWAEWLGVMRRGVVKGMDKPGLSTVRFERVGKPVEVGWGFVMPPAKGEAPPRRR